MLRSDAGRKGVQSKPSDGKRDGVLSKPSDAKCNGVQRNPSAGAKRRSVRQAKCGQMTGTMTSLPVEAEQCKSITPFSTRLLQFRLNATKDGALLRSCSDLD